MSGTRWERLSPPARHHHAPCSLKNLAKDPFVRPGIIANTLPLSPQATTVTYRCRRRIDVSSTNSTRHGRARRRCATRSEWALTNPMIRCQPTP